MEAAGNPLQARAPKVEGKQSRRPCGNGLETKRVSDYRTRIQDSETVARKSKTDKRGFWTIDAETDPFLRINGIGRVPKPFIWGLYTGAGFHTFETVEQVVDAIKDHEVIVYAHNGGKFDFHLRDNTTSLLDHINLREDMKIIDGRLVSAKIGKAEIRDSWNLLPAPLRDFGGKLEIDYHKLEIDVRAQHMPEIIKYLEQDCKGLWDAINTFEQTYGRHLTQAGAAMKQWTNLSGKEPPRTDKYYFAKFQDYYYGGRVQCFERGYIKGPLGVWDIRSAYPRAMLEEHPYAPMYIEIAYPDTVQGPDMVILDCVSIGALPFRDSKGSITFPRDNEKRRYMVTGWEVLAGLETGALREVRLINSIRFSGRENFAVYIQHFYEKRKLFRSAGMEAEAFFAKILMNSLYGKFGANPENYGNFMCVPWDEKLEYTKGDDLDREGVFYDGKRDYQFGGTLGKFAVVRADLEEFQQHFINVATAASVTGWVRAYLWRALNDSDGPVYCDTDCIIARAAPNLHIGDELGEWNKEGVATDAWIAGKKLYYLKGSFEKGKTQKLASKGVKPDAKKIKAAALGAVVLVQSDAPTFSFKGKGETRFQERRIRMTA